MKGRYKAMQTLQYASPESQGIRSRNIGKFIRFLENNHFATHDLILARGNHIFFEAYWKPFHRDFQHRMYSVSKSFVSLAVGFLEQDGKIHLDDKIAKYFPDEMERQTDENMRNQTIRDMLMMSTAKTLANWFEARTDDRVHFYFENPCRESRPSGMFFEYDSTGSFILGALVERLSGKPLIDYLREKVLDTIGFSKEAHFLQCPGGHSWGDSALVCRPMDLLLTARFVLNGGSWDGRQILNREYVRAATTKQIDNDYRVENVCDSQGYGYQFWMTYENSFFFNGMGCQYAVCVPGKDLIMVYNADNQGKNSGSQVIDAFFRLIVDDAEDTALDEDPAAGACLASLTKDLRLLTAQGESHCETEKDINGVTYSMRENPMGISRIRVSFDGDRGVFSYTNGQGDKEIPFGLGYNEFPLFPQEGYSSTVGSVYAPGHYYKCASSAAWVDAHTLRLLVQIIDEYFGNVSITFSFRGGQLGVRMDKTAEDFLNEYQGYAQGDAQSR